METNTIKIAIEAVFKPSMSFYEKMDLIGNPFWEHPFSDWETDRLILKLFDIDKKMMAVLRHDRVILLVENLGILNTSLFNTSFNLFERILSKYVSIIGVPTIKRLGCRLLTYTDFEYTFDELTTHLEKKFYPRSANDLFTITNNHYKDIAYQCVYEHASYDVRLLMGPVHRDELIRRSELTFSQAENIPEASLLVDIDCFKTNIPPTDVVSLLEQIKLYLNEINQSLISNLSTLDR
jgi:hypothetical protein